MISIFLLLVFDGSIGQSLTMDDINVRFTSMENRISDLESELKTLKSKDQDLEMKIELKEVQADVSFILMEQVKLNDRNRALETETMDRSQSTSWNNSLIGLNLNHIDNRQALKRLEELAARKDENVVEVSNVEVPRSQNPIEIHFSGEP